MPNLWDERESYLYKNFVQVGPYVKEMVMDVLNKLGVKMKSAIAYYNYFLYNSSVIIYVSKDIVNSFFYDKVSYINNFANFVELFTPLCN